MTRDQRTRLEGMIYAETFGALSSEERRELYEAAAEEDIFAKLMEAEDLRVAMQTPELKRMVQSALPPAPRPGAVARSWSFGWVLTWASAGACAAGLLVALLYRSASREESSTQQAVTNSVKAPPSRGAESKKDTPAAAQGLQQAGARGESPLAGIFELEPQNSLGGEASWAGAGEAVTRFHPGDDMRIRAACPQNCTVWVFERDAKGNVRLLTPDAGVAIPAGGPASPLEAGGAVPRAPTVPGPGLVRIVAATRSAALFHDGTLDARGLSGPLAVIDLHFEVENTK